MSETLLRHTVPIVINFFNQPSYLTRMISTLIAHDFRDIWIIDQASTSTESRYLLSLLESSSRCRLFRLRENNGPHWFFRSPLFERISEVFVYTDADLEFESGPPLTFLSRLLELTIRYKVGKAGCALKISDNHKFITKTTTLNGVNYSIREWEERFWAKQLEEDVYDAIVDTTFALYNKTFFRKSEFLKAVRVAEDWTMRHLPWYIDNKLSREEWAIYEASCRHSHWFNSAKGAANK